MDRKFMSLENEIKQLIVESLMLEDVEASSIDSESALFGDGLGLDSIDALELAIALERAYGIRLEAKDEKNREIFYSVRTLAAHVLAFRTTAG
jgi:acyl carrier protein